MIIPVKINDIHVNQPARLVRYLLKTDSSYHTDGMFFVDLKKTQKNQTFLLSVWFGVSGPNV